MDVTSKYAILTVQTNLLERQSSAELSPNYNYNFISEAPGTLLRLAPPPPDTLGRSNQMTVQILDYQRYSRKHEALYSCPEENLRKVREDLWPYIISIADPERRLRLVTNQEQDRWIIYLKTNDLVSVSGELFGRGKDVRYDCIIRYIGPVVELLSVGYFFGLELLHLDAGYSPQSEDIPFSIKYMECDPSLSIFTTADWITSVPTDIKKKFSAFDLISGTIEKVRTVIGPSNCIGSTIDSNSLRKGKRQKQREPTAKFYDSSIETSAAQEKTDSKSTLRPDAMDVIDVKQIISMEDEDFKSSVETYEKNLERQHVSKNVTDTPSGHTLPGILKHHRTSSSGSGKDTTIAKPATILSLEDRDIVVIDKADIRESTKNESDVIVVEKLPQQDVDLADILGDNWPNTAGDAGALLNQTRKELQEKKQFANVNNISNNNVNGTGTQKLDRNKSLNPLAHICVKPDRNSSRDTQKFGASNETALTISHPINFRSTATKLNNAASASEASVCEFEPTPSPLLEIPNTALGVGSMVEISIPEAPECLYGVIRWIGVPPGAKAVMVGVELEDDQSDTQLLATDGSFNNVQLFKCHERRALFVAPDRCVSDRRFIETDGAVGGKPAVSVQTDSKMFGQVECPSVAGAVPPIKVLNLDDLEEICGKFKGIQGHHNSCYLDATLFSMFTFTCVFDTLLFRPPEPEDIPLYAEVQKVLREEIVNPLRKNIFVRADRVLKLRQFLDRLSSVSGLMSEEKDPEEFLNSLLAQIMRVEPFLKLNSGQDAYFYQLFVEKDERLSFPTVQQLFEQSFYSSDIKLKEVPSCLIIQMPRFGKSFKMYPRILPSQVLDVTDIIDDSPRQCSVCGKLAEYECRDCFGVLQGGMGLESTSFCRKCLETVHMHAKRANHSFKKLSVPQDFRVMAEHMTVPRVYMELFAVVCIETSHYVAFVKAGSGPDAPWCFFDSMADRKGEQNGYNIPEMRTVPDLPHWLSDEGARTINESSSNDKMLPEHAKRLFCDAYMCMYQSTDVMMYR